MTRWGFKLVGCVTALFPAGCPTVQDNAARINPFTDLEPVAIDGRTVELENDIVALGELREGEVVRLRVSGESVRRVLVLTQDDQADATGVMVGGGPADEEFQYRAARTAPHFLFIEINATSDAVVATLTASQGNASFSPPASQPVVLRFDEGFLSDPGLFDPSSGTDEQQEFLETITEQVRAQIVDRLRDIFAGTPIEILEESETPEGDFSVLRFSPERVPASGDLLADDAVLPPDNTRPECQDLVTFGEVLPSGSGLDAGNQVLDDEAVVYVGSFQGRGETCQSAAINSVNNIVLGLSQTAAHEIGHLIGLHHIALVGIMDRSPSFAFQRELKFARAQILTQQPSEDNASTVVTTVVTSVVQDPAVYFDSIFARQ